MSHWISWHTLLLKVVAHLGVQEPLESLSLACSLRLYDPTQSKFVMVRIDLMCKLKAPILMGKSISITKSDRLDVVAMVAFNPISPPLEYQACRTVWVGKTRLLKAVSTSLEF